MTFPEQDDDTQGLQYLQNKAANTGIERLPRAAQIKLRFHQARKAAMDNDHLAAFKISQELIKLAPENPNAWVYAALYSQNNIERLRYFSKALYLAPTKQSARLGLYEAMREQFDTSPYLRYLGQDDASYQVMTADGQIIPIPKIRPPKYMDDNPPDNNSTLQRAGRWLVNALLTLPFGGFIALICATIAAFLVMKEMRQKSPSVEKRRLWLMLLQIAFVWFGALVISYLFFLHVFSM